MGWDSFEVTGKVGRWEIVGTQDVGRYVYLRRDEREVEMLVMDIMLKRLGRWVVNMRERRKRHMM